MEAAVVVVGEEVETAFANGEGLVAVHVGVVASAPRT
jgi:hypothetical protein